MSLRSYREALVSEMRAGIRDEIRQALDDFARDLGLSRPSNAPAGSKGDSCASSYEIPC